MPESADYQRASEQARYSRYFARALASRPDLDQALAGEFTRAFARAEMENALPERFADEAALKAALRDLRLRVMTRVILRDLAGLADLDEVCMSITALAEVACARAQSAHEAWLHERHGEPIGTDSGTVQKLMIVGMGKLGGGELNVSSDIDLVFVYPEEGETRGLRSLSNHEFFTQLGRRIIASLHEVTEHGFVFRVDMRLRPYGQDGPLATSLGALEEYLVTQGRAWERYAWLKGRVLTGDCAEDLYALVRPFVFRKYLDFDAYAALRDLHRQIREEVARRDRRNDIKLGPGGIREIEFIVQVFQLIRGGREPSLQERSTRAMIDRLAARGLLNPEAAEQLRIAYRFLRNLEHRLQYRDDQQTQSLPAADEELAALAASMGLAGPAALEAVLNGHRQAVSRHFEEVLGGAAEDRPADPLQRLWEASEDEEETRQRLERMGYADPVAVAERLRRVRASGRYQQLPLASRERFDQIAPRLIAVAAETGDPQATCERLFNLLEAVARRSAYLALLIEQSALLPRVAQMVASSSWAAEYLTRHPILLDEMLDQRLLFAAPDYRQWQSQLANELAGQQGDAERQMDILRHFQHAQSFRLLAQDLTGQLQLEKLADHLSALADLVLETTLELCWRYVPVRHVEKPQFAIIAYGKLGGKELGYASDLDLIFLYDDPDDAAPERYARLAQRLNTWLSSTTAAGQLYETDLRLRPNGESGLLVSSLEAFRQYQLQEAWVWEHQALTRARFAAGDQRIGAAFERLREEILRQPRDRAALVREVASMRQKMADGHPNPTPLFDLKHDPGGMVDIEFIVQYLVLAHSHAHQEMTRNLGNIALLVRAGDLGLAPKDLVHKVADYYRYLRRMQHGLRLNGARHARLGPAGQESLRANVTALWEAVLGMDRGRLGEFG